MLEGIPVAAVSIDSGTKFSVIGDIDGINT